MDTQYLTLIKDNNHSMWQLISKNLIDSESGTRNQFEKYLAALILNI